MIAFVLSAAILSAEPELLLLQMDATIRRAKTLRIEFEVREEGNAAEDPLAKGSLVLGDRNRFRHELDTYWLIQQSSLTVSDGKRIGGKPPNITSPPLPPLPEWHNEVVKSWLGRGGAFPSPWVALGYASEKGGKKPGAEDGPQVARAMLLPDEVVGGVKARVVAYELTWRALGSDPEDQVAKVRVWIDPKTKLPLRRSITCRKRDRESTYRETITKFEVDPKLNDKLFELPR